MDLERKKQNYHWTETNISDWVKKNIESELVNRKYSIVKTDIYSKICVRMSKIGMVYTINLDAMKNGKSCVLDNFNNTSEYNEGLEQFPWFLSFFKELQAQAIMKFSNTVLDVGKSTERSFVEVRNTEVEEKKLDSIKKEFLINCSITELIQFMTEEDLIRNWAYNAIFEDGCVKIENMIFSGIERQDKGVKFDFKLGNWNCSSKVDIFLETIRSSTKITLNQSNIPVNEVDVMQSIWYERVFLPISNSFGFTLRLFNDD